MTAVACVSVAGATALALAGCAAHVVQITAGGEHACARMDNGRVRCWGRNDRGALGDGTTEDRATPVEVVGLRDVVEVVAGGGHTCARRAGGSVVCWGSGEGGQLGSGAQGSRPAPVEVASVTGVLQLALGAGHSCALRPTGVACWGNNAVGQLGDGTSDPRSGAVVTTGLAGVVGLAGGPAAGATCARRRDGRAICWGSNRSAELGDPSAAGWSPPAHAIEVEGVTSIAVGGEHTCAGRRDGRVLCWGAGWRGQRGDGKLAGASPAPVQVDGLADAVEVAAGGQHTCARRAGGTVVCWGAGTMGQLGDGAKLDRAELAPVRDVGGAAALALGNDFSCALRDNGDVLCWGANGYGQLGDGTVAPRSDINDLGEYDRLGSPHGPVRVRIDR